jgi:3-hydroxybutyryl-CoA dehydrogenase
MSAPAAIACLGAGRMARGIAVVFAYAGHRVSILDVKAREAAAYAESSAAAIAEVRGILATFAEFGLLPPTAVDGVLARVSVIREQDAAAALTQAAVVFEAVPEVLELKRQLLARLSPLAPSTIIASTTSTILVDALASAVAMPERFLNAHWLNPAFLVPLVELSPGARTDPAVTQRLRALLESIGKVPVVCAARP